jgi:hypothetical protein
MKWFKKKEKTEYLEEELIVCEKKDCVYWRQFSIWRKLGVIMWRKKSNLHNLNLPSCMAGPTPCIFCKDFTGGDCYDKYEKGEK